MEIISKIQSNPILLSLVSTISIPLLIIFISWLLRTIQSICLTILGYFIGRKSAFAFANFLTFPGVMIHELSHALFAVLTGGKVTKINLFNPNGYSLGSVEFQPRGSKTLQGIQLTLIGIAPTIIGSILFYKIFQFLITHNNLSIGIYILLIYLLFCIFFHISMSPEDVKGSITGLYVLLPVLFLIIFFTKFDIFTFLMDSFSIIQTHLKGLK